MADKNDSPSSKETKARCAVCGSPFHKVTNRKYCSDTCRLVKLREQQRNHYHAKVRDKRAVKDKTTPCIAGCGVIVEYVTNKRVYCEACRLDTVRRAERQRQRKYRIARRGDELFASAERARLRKFREENREIINARESARKKKKVERDPLFAMSVRIRARIGGAVRRNGISKNSSTLEILGCEDWGEFKKHIERQFLSGMSWENRDKWHIDHIVPLDSAATEEDILALNHYTNLRPLWAGDNMRKHKHRMHLL